MQWARDEVITSETEVFDLMTENPSVPRNTHRPGDDDTTSLLLLLSFPAYLDDLLPYLHLWKPVVNFMCQFEGQMDVQRADKAPFLDMSMRISQKIFESVDWIKKIHPSPMWAGIIQFIEDPNRTKGGRENSLFPLSWEIHLLLPLDIRASVLGGFPRQWITSLALLVLQLSDSRSWHIFASIIMWANVHNKFYPYILLVLFL